MQNKGQEQNIKFSFHTTVQIRNYTHFMDLQVGPAHSFVD